MCTNFCFFLNLFKKEEEEDEEKIVKPKGYVLVTILKETNFTFFISCVSQMADKPIKNTQTHCI